MPTQNVERDSNLYDSSISEKELLFAAYFTQAIVRLREEMGQKRRNEKNEFLRQFYPTFTFEGGSKLHFDDTYESIILFTDKRHRVQLPLKTNYYLLWFVFNNARYNFVDKYEYGYWSSDSTLIRTYQSRMKYLPPNSYSITRPIDLVLAEISRRVYHHVLVKNGQITHQAAYGAVGVVCDDLGINCPNVREYYDDYNFVKASPRRISSYQKKVKKNKI